MSRTSHALRGLLLLGAMAMAPLHPERAAAQDAAQRLARQLSGQELSSDQILERLRASGLTRDQAKTRLTQGGLDPTLVDPYFNRIEGGAGPLPQPGSEFLQALGQLGVLSTGIPATAVADNRLSFQAEVPPSPTGTLEVFGLDVFRRATDQFDPVSYGPVDAEYRLGPGDQVVLIITGDVELAYSLDVTREGFIVIPDVGQVSVNGVSLQGLRERLYDRLGRVYSGVRRSADATTQFDVSLGRLRTNQVFVIGDVARPGAYQISSVGTVLTALYRGGGPTANGSFRAVTVQRGGSVVAEVDLYDYLLRGNAGTDIRLEHGDVVFVPPVGPQVTMLGEVRRPAIYEVRPGESLADAVRFSGGVLPEAYVQRVQVDRVLPPQDRHPGRDRVLLDADVKALETGRGPAFPVEAGDRVTVFGVLDRTRGRVALHGAVWRPGAYEFSPGMTVSDLLERGDGLRPSAYTRLVHVRRLVEATGTTRLLRVSLDGTAPEFASGTLPLEDLDEVTVFDIDSLSGSPQVEILGEVQAPGRYALDENTTVEDLILAAGGFTDAADPSHATVSRVRRSTDRSDTLSIRYSVRLREGPPVLLRPEAYVNSDDSLFDGVASEFALENADQVFITRLAGWVDPGHAIVRGEVTHPGFYPLESRHARISDLVARAGGTTEQAYVEGGNLERDGVPVALDLPEALRHPGGASDVLLRPGDLLTIPAMDPTVTVEGNVVFPVRVLYREGKGVDSYLAAAGGTDGMADLNRVSVRYPNGRRAIARKFIFFRRFPKVEPGSRIFVPSRTEGTGTDWEQFLSRSLGVATSVLTILVLSNQLK